MWLLIVAGPVLVVVDLLKPETRLRALGLLLFCGGSVLAILMRIDESVGKVWAAGERAGDRRRALEAETPDELLGEREKRDRRKFRLIKGGVIGGTVLGTLAWLRHGRRFAASLTAAGVAIAGATVVEFPGSPGADPPTQVIARPPNADPTKRPTVVPTVRPTSASTPQRTSPQRTQASATVAPPTVVPSTVTPPSVIPTPAKPSISPTVAPTPAPSTTTPMVTLPVKPTVSTTPLPVVDATAACTGVKLLGGCLLAAQQ